MPRKRPASYSQTPTSSSCRATGNCPNGTFWSNHPKFSSKQKASSSKSDRRQRPFFGVKTKKVYTELIFADTDGCGRAVTAVTRAKKAPYAAVTVSFLKKAGVTAAVGATVRPAARRQINRENRAALAPTARLPHGDPFRYYNPSLTPPGYAFPPSGIQ